MYVVLYSIISLWICLITTVNSATNSAGMNLLTKLIPAKDTLMDNAKDLTPSASDRTFHINKEYSQPGIYGATYPYGNYFSTGENSIYGPSSSYHGIGLGTRYSGYPRNGPTGILGGGHIGYGYYGNTGYNPTFGTLGGFNPYTRDGYRGFGTYGINDGYGRYAPYGTGSGGYGTYGGGVYSIGNRYVPYGTGGYELRGYSDNYLGYNSNNRYLDDEYGYGSNYGSIDNSRFNIDPYGYRGINYRSNIKHPSGYRGYS